MAIRTVLTTKGMELLANSASDLGGNYWLGYFSLAYVPQEWKDSHDPVYSGMTKLTEYGDTIFNVWQGDYTGSGYLGNENQYSQNVKVHYRYKLDDNKLNNLVVWDRNDNFNDTLPISDTNYEFIGSRVYSGTNGQVNGGVPESGDMPIPAPLYYTGDIAGKGGDISSILADMLLDSIYVPTIGVDSSILGHINVPKVSVDARGYSKSSSSVADPIISGLNFDTVSLPSISSNYTHWYSSTTTDLSNNAMSDELHSLVTISNYNRYHTAPSESVVDFSSELKANNMSKSTKYFPVKSFSVLSGNNIVSSNSGTRSVATGIKLKLAFDISPSLSSQGWNDDGEYDISKNVLLANRYGNNQSSPSDLYNTVTSSFKYNRVGVYAVFVRKVADASIDDSSALSSDDRLVYEIDPDVEPVLFAVADFDNTQYVDESGDPSSEFEMDFSINLSTYDDSIGDSSLIRDNIVFFNLYEDDAIKYYKNQLLMTSQLMYSINKQSLDIGSMRRSISQLEKNIIGNGARGNDISSITNIGKGSAAIYSGKDITSGSSLLRTISGVGIKVYERDDTVVIDGSGYVTSSTTILANSGNERSMAYFDKTKNNITSTGNNLTIDGTTLTIRNDGVDKYTDVGYKVNDISVTSNGLIETIVKKISFSNSASGNPDVTSGVAMVSLDELGINQYDVLRSISWSLSPQAYSGNVYNFSVERISDSSEYIVSSSHDGDMQKSAIIFEPIHLNDPVDYAVDNLRLKWTSVPDAIEFEVYVVVDRIPDEFNNLL